MKVIASLIYPCDRFGESECILDADDLSVDKHKLLILHGGEDISPGIYGEAPVKTTAPAAPSYRDRIEMDAIKKAWELEIPILGICRGAQLLCAMQGGALYQDAPAHNNAHQLLIVPTNQVETVRKIQTNSLHHQMMIPKDHILLAHAGEYGSPRWRDYGLVTDIIQEPEVVWWKKSLSLGVQGHPEWDRSVGGIYTYTKELLYTLFGI